MQTIELVTFRTPSMGSDDFLAANDVINTWLSRQPGFIARHLGARDDGTWVDVVLWKSDAEAKAAADRLPRELGMSEAMAAIDPASIAMSHAAVRMSVG